MLVKEREAEAADIKLRLTLALLTRAIDVVPVDTKLSPLLVDALRSKTPLPVEAKLSELAAIPSKATEAEPTVGIVRASPIAALRFRAAVALVAKVRPLDVVLATSENVATAVVGKMSALEMLAEIESTPVPTSGNERPLDVPVARSESKEGIDNG